MIGPTKKPQDFGFKNGDTHLIVNDITEVMTAYDSDGTKLWEIPCLARGQGNDTDWKHPRTDTPPGLYKLGAVYDDYSGVGDACPYDRTHLAYGWVTFDMVSLDHHEEDANRAGICMHGGGSGCGWPGAWAPHQHLVPTFGCVRAYNDDLYHKILPLTKKGNVFVSVFQEG